MANRSRGAYDVVIETPDVTLGYVLARESGKPAVVPTQLDGGRADEQIANADVPRVIDNLDAGMGFSRRLEKVPNGYSHCLPGYTRAPGAILCPAGKVTEAPMPLAPSGWQPAAIRETHEFHGDLYFVTYGPHVLRSYGGISTPEAVAYGGAAFGGQSAAVFNDHLYVGGGSGLLDGDAAGFWTLSAPQRGFLRAVDWRPQGIPTQFLVGVVPGSAISYVPITKDPRVDANWVAPIKVGADQAFGINGIIAAPRHVYYTRPDGVYDMDELGVRSVNLAPWFAENRDRANGLWGLHTGAGLYVEHSQGLAYLPTNGDWQQTPIWCQPGYGLPWEGPIRGQVTAGTFHAGWVGTAVFDGDTSYLCWGTPDQAAYGRATHTWHGAEAVFPGERITHMRVHTTSPQGGWPTLLIATVSGNWNGVPHAPYDNQPPYQVKLYWQSLAKIGTPAQELVGEPLTEVLGGSFTPADASSLFFSADPWDRPSAVKTMLQFDLLTERLSSLNSLTLSVAADEGAYVEQGQATDGSYTSIYPVELTEGRYIKTRIAALGSPLLRSVEMRAAVGIDLREARIYRLLLAWDNALVTARGRDRGDPERRMSELRALLGRVVTLDDGRRMRVRVLQVMQPERRQIGPAARSGGWAIVVPLMVSILDRPLFLDSGDILDGDGVLG